MTSSGRSSAMKCPQPGTSSTTMSANGVVVVWATRESGTPAVRISSGSTSRTVTGASRLVPGSQTGLGFDYYHHEVAVGSLAASTIYNYDATLTNAPVASASFPGRNGKIAYLWIGESAYRAGPTATSIRTVDPRTGVVRVLRDCPRRADAPST